MCEAVGRAEGVSARIVPRSREALLSQVTPTKHYFSNDAGGLGGDLR